MADRTIVGSSFTFNNFSISSTMLAITDPVAVVSEYLTGSDPNVAFIATTPVMKTFSIFSGISSIYQRASVEDEVAQEVPNIMVTSVSLNIQHPSTVSPGRSEMLLVPPDIPPGRQNRLTEENSKDRNRYSAAFAAQNARQPAPGSNQNRSAAEIMNRLNRLAASFASRTAFQQASSGKRIAPAPLRPGEAIVRIYRQPPAFTPQNGPQPATNAERFTQGKAVTSLQLPTGVIVMDAVRLQSSLHIQPSTRTFQRQQLLQHQLLSHHVVQAMSFKLQTMRSTTPFQRHQVHRHHLFQPLAYSLMATHTHIHRSATPLQSHHRNIQVHQSLECYLTVMELKASVAQPMMETLSARITFRIQSPNFG